MAAAAPFDGVLPRWQLHVLGFGRREIARAVKAGRWAGHGTHTIALHTGPLSERAARWRAIWETAQGVALLDGVSSLHAAGLTGFSERLIHVSVPRNARCPQPEGVRIHRLRQSPSERVEGGIPRTRSEVAAVRAAHWAMTDRQAALILAMAVQQRLTTGMRLVAATQGVTCRARRSFIKAVAIDVAGGAESLGELDFARACRRHGIPEPSRQVVRQGTAGRIYLDARWDRSKVVVEIDGAGHRWGLAVSADNLRANEVSLGGDTVLRIDLLGLRLNGDEFLAQVRRAVTGCV